MTTPSTLSPRWDYPSRDYVHKVLDEAFQSRLDTVMEFMGKYASSDFRVAVGK
jgi:hypothetical protein